MSSDPTPPPSPTPEIRGAARLRETRYSLPELLSELQLERNSGSFAMEKLNQAEIGKMFDNLRKRRAKKI